ncbi:recombination-associated protein RdgC [sulfur-oxidizing endosymbiont of Gigantopelta aegis]|uniref:recombination-associated protein RdgC n=1 Tax=sulfur-oxidizing endosymbiont of Gigantopelta aegis TaxID=2794934 RepID=UPI0018DC583B|nr:recombination-associated protein RdgC [sulfur-oxidizing endosymbiont of Gigantopelta aegis]
MWFKNLKIYRFSKPFSIDSEQLETQLAEKSFQPCGSTQASSFGWVAPLSSNDNDSIALTHSIAKTTMICVRLEERILPSSVINDSLNEKLDAIQTETGRRPVGKHKQSIRDELILTLLPKAFTRSKRSYAYLDQDAQLLIVDASSNNKAEELVELLRQTLGSLPVMPLKTNTLPILLMTNWLKGNDLKDDFEIKDECELREADDEGAILRCKRQDLRSDEIQMHLDNGKEVTKLAVNWSDRLECIIEDDLSIKRLKFSDELLDQASDDGAEDAAAQFDADFNLMTGELAHFIPRLVEVLGGEQTSAIKT